jgi:metallophosphoesterase superfamily enzyme
MEAKIAEHKRDVLDNEMDDHIDTDPLLSDSVVFRLSGHKHPGIRLKSNGRQSITLPCFHVTGSDVILPAFGDLTGLHLISHQQDDEVYAIAEDEVFRIPFLGNSNRARNRNI